MSQDFVNEIPIEISPNILRKILNPKDDDPNFYLAYKIYPTQLKELNEFLSVKIVDNFDSYTYYLVCEGVYNW